MIYENFDVGSDFQFNILHIWNMKLRNYLKIHFDGQNWTHTHEYEFESARVFERKRERSR